MKRITFLAGQFLFSAFIFSILIISCSGAFQGNETVEVAINLLNEARASTGFNGRVDSAELDWTVTLTGRNGRVKNAEVNPEGTHAAARVAPGDYDIDVSVSIRGFPYSKGQVKSFNVTAGHNAASVEMERLSNAVVLSIPNRPYNMGSFELYDEPELVVTIHNYTDKEVNISSTADHLLINGISSYRAVIRQDEADSIKITTPILGEAGNFAETLSFTWDGGSISIPFSLTAYSPDIAGSGAPGDPFHVRNIRELSYVGRGGEAGVPAVYQGWSLSVCYILMKDLMLTDAWQPIGGATGFSGAFDGNNKTINLGNDLVSGVDTFYGYCAGLFSLNSGEIKNLILKGSIHLEESADVFAAAATGINAGTVKNISSSVTVFCKGNGSYYSTAGGIVGSTNSTGIIKNCYSTGNVTAETTYMSPASAGGIVGNNTGTISYCWEQGTITAAGSITYNYAGGIAGQSDQGTIENCVALNDPPGGVNGSAYSRIVGYKGTTTLQYNHASDFIYVPPIQNIHNQEHGNTLTSYTNQNDWKSDPTGITSPNWLPVWWYDPAAPRNDDTPWHWDDDYNRMILMEYSLNTP